LETAPRSVVALNGLGVALDLRGRHADAARRYDEALAVEPTNRSVMSNQALSRALAGDPAAAAAALDRIARGPGAPPQAAQNLALAYAMEGRLDAAQAILSETLGARQASDTLDFYRSVLR
jgi:Flp pilus assembly protein TadD